MTTLVALLDHAHDVLLREVVGGRGPGDVRALALERLVLFGLVPALTILVLFRDDPRRYGLRLGSWRLGLGLAVGGSLLSTLGGGLVFGWIDWRTGSILWSALFHVWILTLVILAAAAATS